MHYFIFSVLLGLISTNVYSQNVNSNDLSYCGLNEKSQKLAKLIINDPKQQRSELVCNKRLSEVADDKAREMAKGNRVRHKAPNKKLIDAGYPLARIYPRLFENNVEAIAGGIPDATKMWEELKLSDGHRIHLLAEHEFYKLQNEIGVGYYRDLKSKHVEYWVVYVAHRENQKEYDGEIAKSKD